MARTDEQRGEHEVQTLESTEKRLADEPADERSGRPGGVQPELGPQDAATAERVGVLTGGDGVRLVAQRATVDPAALERGFEVMIHADLAAKDLAIVQAFEERLAAMDEVAELRRMFGLPDYFIRMQVADAAAFEHWLTTQLLGDPAIVRVDSRITMKVLKCQR